MAARSRAIVLARGGGNEPLAGLSLPLASHAFAHDAIELKRTCVTDDAVVALSHGRCQARAQRESTEARAK
jgi:hypothetical protein